MDQSQDSKFRLTCTTNLFYTQKNTINKQRSKHMINVSISNDQELKNSYSILKLQMDDDGKVVIHTNRRMFRTYSAKHIIPQQSSFINTSQQYFVHAPIRIPTPLHQITLKKQQKPIYVRIHEQTIPKQQTGTSELIRKKILNAQRKTGSQSQSILNKMSIQPKVSYQKLFNVQKSAYLSL